MTEKERKHVLMLIERSHTARSRAHNAYMRYTWHPSTATGAKDHERWEKWDAVYENTMKELYAILGGGMKR